MPITNITSARVAGNFFYIKSVDRRLFNLGRTTVRVITAEVRELPATVNPQPGGIQPFLVHCPELFRTNVPPLLPLQDGDVVQYEVGSDGVRITNIQKSGAENPPIPTSRTQIQRGNQSTRAPRSTTYRQRPNPTAERALSQSPVPQLPSYLEENKSPILSLPPQTLSPWNCGYDSYAAPVMERLRESFPNRNITREALIDLFASWDDPVLGLVATMVWGMISTGGQRGDNLQPLLDMGEVVLKQRAEALRELIRHGELKRAFQDCSPGGPLKLNGVDYAFFTKLFCFIGHAPPTLNPAPLILDSRTSSAFFVLGAQAAPKLPWTDLCKTEPLYENKAAPWRSPPTPALYTVFVNWFNHWAGSLGCNALQLEQFVFGISRNTHAGKSHRNPRTQLENLGKTLFLSA